jgi:hypothetical protein
MANFKSFAWFVLAATVASNLGAETHCPGNVASLPFHFVNRHQIIVAVSVNNSGPQLLIGHRHPAHDGRSLSGRGTPFEHLR